MSVLKAVFIAPVPCLILCLALCLVPGPASAQTIDHAFVKSHGYDALGPEAAKAVAGQVWMFSHASVGANILDGMDTLHYENPAKYPLVRTEAGLEYPPAVPAPGAVYDIDRGNPDWSEKLALFRDAVTRGWGARAHFVMDKFCYIDQNADASSALALLEGVEASSPAIVVYTTMPLTTEADHDNDLRNAYNKAIRAHVAANDKLLFDIADIEAHDASGRECVYGGGKQRLCDQWTDDGGHLDGGGQILLAKAWYAMAASQALQP